MGVRERIERLEECVALLRDESEEEAEVRASAKFYGIPEETVRAIRKECFSGPNPGGIAEYLGALTEESQRFDNGDRGSGTESSHA